MLGGFIMSYKEYIYSLRQYWIGKKVVFEHHIYNVVGVDYNGAILIDKKTKYCDSYTSEDTAVSISDVKEV